MFRHIIGDFWSLVLLVEELRALYPAERGDRPVTLPKLPLDYSDFVHWQSEMLSGPEGERLGRYWEERLKNLAPVLYLPTDRPRPPSLTHRGAAHPFHVAASLVTRLRKLARAEGVTLYTLLLATYETLLGRYTGQDDFAIGSPFACRRPGFEGIVGYFSNMVPLRTISPATHPFASFWVGSAERSWNP